MDFQSFKVRYLESLSTSELVELADRNGLDIPPGLERVFVISELLDLERYAHRDEGDEERDVKFGGLPELPSRYGVSRVDVLVRDPLWAFAFWECKRPAPNRNGAAADLFLRVVPLRGSDLRADGEAALEVAAGREEGSLYVGIPCEMGRDFRIDLCARQGAGAAALAASAPFRMPALADAREAGALALMSGAQGFPTARSAGRPRKAE